MSTTIGSKDAFFMLDVSFDEAIKMIKEENTAMVIKTINGSKEIYNRVKGAKSARALKAECMRWAKEHNDEFGDMLSTELDAVVWKVVLGKL